MRGRHSNKKIPLLNIYRVLRCAMTFDDIAALKERAPGLKERDETSTDIDILVGIEFIVDAMSSVSPPDWERREPL